MKLCHSIKNEGCNYIVDNINAQNRSKDLVDKTIESFCAAPGFRLNIRGETLIDPIRQVQAVFSVYALLQINQECRLTIPTPYVRIFDYVSKTEVIRIG